MGFHHVGPAGLKLLTSGDPPTSASQISGITGMSHRSRPGPEIPNICSLKAEKPAPRHCIVERMQRAGDTVPLISSELELLSICFLEKENRSVKDTKWFSTIKNHYKTPG